jgi:tryptophan synthase beta chain
VTATAEAPALQPGRRRATSGPYGGRFVPEALIAALDELTDGLHGGRADDEFQASSPACCATTPVGRRR